MALATAPQNKSSKGVQFPENGLETIVFGAGLCEASMNLRSGSESINHRS